MPVSDSAVELQLLCAHVGCVADEQRAEVEGAHADCGRGNEGAQQPAHGGGELRVGRDAAVPQLRHELRRWQWGASAGTGQA